jgi:nicotinamidase-related amidase
MTLTPENSLLVVVDVQGKLASLMIDKDNLYKNMGAVIDAANLLSIPVFYTEQAPEKIGATIPEITVHLKNARHFTKKTFSCAAEEDFATALKSSKRKQIILIGIETHVCVYQTARDLLSKKHQVYPVADAIASRKPTDKHFGLNRMQQLGAQLVCVEMLLTELIQTSAHPKFKEILNLIR